LIDLMGVGEARQNLHVIPCSPGREDTAGETVEAPDPSP
jgi:hypothetical protein